jgi:hypothetical protein
VAAGERRTRQQRHLQDGVVVVLDVLEEELQGAVGRAPPAVAPGGVVARRRRGRAIVCCQLAFVPTMEERGPCLPIVGVEAWIGALLVGHRLDDLIDGGVESGARWRRRDWDATGAILWARGSPAAPCSRPRIAAGPPTGAGSAGQNRCWSRRPRPIGSPPLLEEVGGGGGEVDWGRCWRMWPARRGRPRYIGGLALTRLAAWLAVHRRQLLQRAEDDARGRRRCAEDKTMRTTTAHSRRQVGATRRAGIFLAVSRAFLSSGVPGRAPEGRGWPGLAGWMKAQIRAKTRIGGRD